MRSINWASSLNKLEVLDIRAFVSTDEMEGALGKTLLRFERTIRLEKTWHRMTKAIQIDCESIDPQRRSTMIRHPTSPDLWNAASPDVADGLGEDAATAEIT